MTNPNLPSPERIHYPIGANITITFTHPDVEYHSNIRTMDFPIKGVVVRQRMNGASILSVNSEDVSSELMALIRRVAESCVSLTPSSGPFRP